MQNLEHFLWAKITDILPVDPKTFGILVAILFLLISFLFNLLQRRRSRTRLDRLLENLLGHSASIPVRQIEAGVCSDGYGWCPDGFKWIFQITDPAVNANSVVAINIVNPLLYDYGCEVATKGTGEFRIMCIGDDYVTPKAILQYAVFNP